MSNCNISGENSNTSQERPIYCMACGERLRRFSMLVCPECLDDNCNAYLLKSADEDVDENY